jgi:hypothetical protein
VSHKTGDDARPTAKPALERPTRRQGRVGAQSRGGGHRLDFSVIHQ